MLLDREWQVETADGLLELANGYDILGRIERIIELLEAIIEGHFPFNKDLNDFVDQLLFPGLLEWINSSLLSFSLFLFPPFKFSS